MVPKPDGTRARRAGALLTAMPVITLAAVAAVIAGSAGSAVADEHKDAEPKRQQRPALSISVADKLDAIAPGDPANYVITLGNNGAEDVQDVNVMQTFPAGMKVLDRGGAEIRRGGIGWTTDIEPGATVTYRVEAVMGKPDPGVTRASVTACAAHGDDTAPLVCATDADLLPAGNGADDRAAGPADTIAAVASSWPFLTVVAILVVAAVAAVVVLVRGRRRPRRPPPTRSGRRGSSPLRPGGPRDSERDPRTRRSARGSGRTLV